ncbi:transcriptional regulator ATRX [Acrasis kona]|uniref:Transcriptional regulator ATRX n=1 Tax=Acrasis kona TaxID=1008807 RepID=A0AAW2ZNJ2_9EUKA
MEFLLRLIGKLYESDEKMLIFTQYTEMIDVMEDHLSNYKIKFKDGSTRALQNEIDYLRLDGSCRSKDRQRMIDEFNQRDSEIKVFLISTLAGGQGINLTAASRVVVFDVTWDPTWSSQSIFRAYRFGQTRPVHIYRFVTCGTVEENIWLRCVAKMWLFKRIVDNRIPERKISMEDLNLFNSNGVDTRTNSDEPLLNPQVYGQDDMLKALLGTQERGAMGEANVILHPFTVTQQDIENSQIGGVDNTQSQANTLDPINYDEQEALRNGGEFDVNNKIASVFHYESLYLDDLNDKLTDEQGERSLREYEAQHADARRARMNHDREYNSQESEDDEMEEVVNNGGGDHPPGGPYIPPVVPPEELMEAEPEIMAPVDQQMQQELDHQHEDNHPPPLSQEQQQEIVQQLQRQLLMM